MLIAGDASAQLLMGTGVRLVWERKVVVVPSADRRGVSFVRYWVINGGHFPMIGARIVTASVLEIPTHRRCCYCVRIPQFRDPPQCIDHVLALPIALRV